jgi:4-hydroxybenzoate adenylyltransferase
MRSAAPGGFGPATGNLAVTLERLAWQRGWAANPAYLVDDQHYSYAEVYRGAWATAGVLAAEGVGPGDRVLIVLPDGIDFVWSFLATVYLGAVAVLANPRLPAHELAAAAERTDPALVVGDAVTLAAFEPLPVLDPARMARGWGRAPAVAAHASSPSDPAYALFTSGTTGEPKLCFHSHADALVYQDAFGGPALALRPGDVTLSVSKAYFAYGLGNSLFYPLASGAAAVLEPAPPAAGAVLASIARFGVSVLFAVPSFYARLLAHPQVEWLASVGIAVCAGEVLPGAVEQRMDALGGPVLLNGIGSTEVGQTFASSTRGARRPGSVGRALPPYQVKVVNEAGECVPAGTEGRLMVAGPTIALPCRTAAGYRAASPGAWHSTGDLATLDGEGFLYVSGRHDDIQIVGGINVHPAEIEDVLASHPLVRDVAVCATTDPRGVSRLVAYVVAAPGGADTLALEADLLVRARDRLAAFKVPRGVVFVPELPRTFTGKLRRRLLKDAAARYEATRSWQLHEQAGREGREQP